MANDNEVVWNKADIRAATPQEVADGKVSATELSPTPEKRSIFSKVKPYLNRTTFTVALALASTFGFVAPETATKLRNVVAMLPVGTGDLLN